MGRATTMQASTTATNPTLELQAGLSVHELHRRLRAAHYAETRLGLGDRLARELVHLGARTAASGIRWWRR